MSDVSNATTKRSHHASKGKLVDLSAYYRAELKKRGGIKMLAAIQVRRALDPDHPKGFEAAKNVEERIGGKVAQAVEVGTTDNQPFPVMIIPMPDTTEKKKK